jgi:hypothetical protein
LNPARAITQNYPFNSRRYLRDAGLGSLVESERTIVMGLRSQLFGTNREAIRLSNFDAGKKSAEVSATVLREVIDRGCAGPDGSNRGRLATLFARGYLFGFSESCIQGFGVFDEIESLAIVTVVHNEMFGGQIGWLLVQDALREHGQAEFDRGQTAGADDFLRWLSDLSIMPRSLTKYLLEGGDMSSSSAATGDSAAESGIATKDAPARCGLSTANDALIRKRATMAAVSDSSIMTISLGERLHMKTVKPISH